MVLVPFSIIILLDVSEKFFDEVVSVRHDIVRKGRYTAAIGPAHLLRNASFICVLRWSHDSQPASFLSLTVVNFPRIMFYSSAILLNRYVACRKPS
jgi:hypothetical protein